jgi:D-lactate dehydrogenase
MEKEIVVSLFDAKSYDREFFEKHNGLYGFKIKYYANHLTPDTVALARGANAVCAFVNCTLNREVIEALCDMQVKLIALRASGYNNVDLKAAYGKIPVVRVPAYSPHAVAEHAAALILSLNRKIHRAYYRVRDNNFSIQGLMGFNMHGKTAGIIGTGQIGKVMIQILKGFGMRVLAFDLFPDPVFQKEASFDYVDLDMIYRESDIISLHCPLAPKTFHLINAEALSKMKKGALIINTGRGGLIDSKALVEALKTGSIGGAGLDVYEEESDYFFEDFSNSVITDDVLARLLSFNNVLITSHQGFFTQEAVGNIAETTLKNIDEFFSSGKRPNEICYQCGKSCVKNETGKCF